MLFRIVVFLLFSTILNNLAYGQQVKTDLISEIKFEGVKKNNVAFLTEQIVSAKGVALSDSLISRDIQQLKNLSGIGNVTYRIEEDGNRKNLVFEVSEVRTLLPILTSGRITNNLWFKVGFVDINWRGKGQLLSADYLNSDGRHSGNIFYKNPKILNSKWGYSASLTSWSSLEPLFFDEGTVNYEYSNDEIGLSGIYNLDRFRNFEVGATFFVETYERSEEQISDINVGIDRLSQPKFLTKWAYSENKLNYDLFYLNGIAWFAKYQNVLNSVDKSIFHILQVQATGFLKVRQLGNLATRVLFGLASNEDSPFAPFVADSHTNIRGIGNRIDRGTAQFIINTEYRHAFVQRQKLGVQGVLFSDIGTWRNPGGKIGDLFNSDQIRVFTGLGFRVIYPKIYGAVLRVDYSIDLNDNDTRGLVIGLGQYF